MNNLDLKYEKDLREWNELCEKMAELKKKLDWTSVIEKLPELDKEVLCYYEIASKSKEVYKYLVIGKLEEISNRKSGITTYWTDHEGNSINPSHWMILPEPPKNKP